MTSVNTLILHFNGDSKHRRGSALIYVPSVINLNLHESSDSLGAICCLLALVSFPSAASVYVFPKERGRNSRTATNFGGISTAGTGLLKEARLKAWGKLDFANLEDRHRWNGVCEEIKVVYGFTSQLKIHPINHHHLRFLTRYSLRRPASFVLNWGFVVVK
ncbi:hypothetical protein F5146DRAFT_1228386 [Armillaria mellea]|nr:hypothetical protein F5146DRAFT_1228386 [Armillaria mellea]